MHTYRGYIIEDAHPLCPEPFQFRHEDYDGPEDNRCGTATSLNDAIEQINDKVEMEEAA